MKHYLYFLPEITYNNALQYYELEPLINSDHSKTVVFAGKGPLELNSNITQTISPNPNQGSVYIYFESEKEIDDKSHYNNVLIIAQIIALSTQIYTLPRQLKLSEEASFEEIKKSFGSDKFSEPGVRFNGMGEGHGSLEYLPTFFTAINKLSENNFKKFQNALYTFALSKEIERYPNPHLKYTLQMTLFISSLNQLSDDVVSKCGGKLVCQKCCKEANLEHKDSSERSQIRKLIEDCLKDKSEADIKLFYLKLAINAYDTIRSGFLHSGKLSGLELSGGFLANEPADTQEMIENLINLQSLNSIVLREFVTINQPK